MSVEENKKNIAANRRLIFELEHEVLGNKANSYLTRDYVLENRDLILRNYHAAFEGNRQLANANTDALFRNRHAVVKNLHVGDDPVKVNFREALNNRAKLEFLDHRSKLNEQVNSVTEELIAINARLIELNKGVMKINEEIVHYNSNLIEENKAWIDGGGIGHENATAESNAKIIAENAAKIQDISNRAKANSEKNHKNYEAARTNRTKLEANAAKIYDRREQILANKQRIQENAQKLAKHTFA